MGVTSLASSITFALIVGINPLSGIWTSIIVGTIASLTGGRPGLISGAAGAVTVLLASLVRAHGISYLFPVLMTVSLFELAFSYFSLSRVFLPVVSHNINCGFLNGLGFLLLKSQLGVFTPLKNEFLASAVFVAVLTSAVSKILPKYNKNIPPVIAGVGTSTIVSSLFDLPVSTLGDVAGKATFAGGLSALPKLALPSASLLPDLASYQGVVLPAAFSIALVSVLQTILATKVLQEASGNSDECTDNDRTILGLSLGNAASVLFGGIGGCGLIPLSTLNVQAGGRQYASSFTYAAAVALSVMLFAPLIAMIPIASLAGVMIVVSLSTVQWKWSLASFKDAFPSKRTSALKIREKAKFAVLLATSYACFFVDMGAGVGVGIGLSMLANKLIGEEKQ